MADVLRADIIGRDLGASATLRSVGRESGVAAEQVRRLAEAQDKQRRAADASAAATLASARADKILRDASDEAIASVVAQRYEQDKLAKSAKDASGKNGLGALVGQVRAAAGGGSGMGALVAIGTALSPILFTLGTGLGGLGLAAYGIAKPIENAAQKTGGLQKNLHLLNPEQQTVARGLLGLGKSFAGFEKQLQPVVLGDFNKGLKLAGSLLHDIEPVTVATGKGLGSVLSQISKEFASGTWQQFFGFMARTAAPDLRQLGTLFTSLLQSLPPLLEALQPIGQEFLTMGTDAARSLTPISNELKVFTGNVQGSEDNLTKAGHAADSWFTTLTNHIPGIHAVNDWLTRVQNSLGYAGQAAQKAAPPVHRVAQSFADTSSRITQVIGPMDHLGKVADATRITQDNWGKVLHRNNGELVTEAHQLNVVAGAYTNALTPLENYINDQIAEANDLHALNQALKASHDRIGLKTQAERNSYAATQTFIQQTIKSGDSAVKTGKGIQGQIDVIDKAIPRLEAVKGKTAAYKAELDLLKGILDKLRQEKLIQEQIKVTGRGTWSAQGLPGPISAHLHGTGHAEGWRVPGYGGGDRWPALLEGGEAVVPKHLTPALAPFLKAHGVPGFTSGGIMPSYGPGSPAGLPPWTASNQHATVVGITNAIGKAFANSLAAAAMTGFGGHGVIPTGPIQAYARQLVGRVWPGLGEWLAFADIVARESGWNPFATNPSSGAYGIPQALPGSKMASAGADWRTNPYTQLRWMVGYLQQRWGDPIAADRNEMIAHWYGSGLRGGIFTRPTIIGVGERGAERVDVTPVGRSGGGALVHVDTMVVQDATDMQLVSSRLNFLVTAASLGS